MMIQLQRLGNMEENEDLQPIARELNHHIQQSGMEYMRKMSWIAERLRRQTILFASKNHDSILLEQSLFDDKENWVTDNPTSRTPKTSHILQDTILKQPLQNDKRVETTKSTPSKPNENKTQLEKANTPNRSSSHHSNTKTTTTQQSKDYIQSTGVKGNGLSQTKANIENNKDTVSEATSQGIQTVKDDKEEQTSLGEEPKFQSVKERIQKFSNTIHDQDREKQLEQYTKATLLSKRSKHATTNNLQYISSPEKQVTGPSSSSVTEEHSYNHRKSEDYLENLLKKTTESSNVDEPCKLPEKKMPENVSNQSETKQQAQETHNSSERLFSVPDNRERIQYNQEQGQGNTGANRKSSVSGKPQLWTNLPRISIERVKESKKEERSVQDKKFLRSKSDKSHKLKNKDTSKKIKNEEVTSLFSAFKQGWSKIAKPRDLQLFKNFSPSTATLEKEAPSSSPVPQSTNAGKYVPDSLETSFPQSDLSRIHEPALPLYPIQVSRVEGTVIRV